MKKVSMWLAAIVLSAGVVLPLVPAKVNAGVDLWSDPYSETEIGYTAFDQIGLGKRDPRVIAAEVIRVLLGFLGVIAVILILFGGFKWMTANGNDKNITDAKNIMKAGAVGLLIVLAAFGVSIYITRALLGVTGGQAQATYQNE